MAAAVASDALIAAWPLFAAAWQAELIQASRRAPRAPRGGIGVAIGGAMAFAY